uniref:Uncharacterized protein n=1 Tax=Arundo donax TaxID=35708 RepID=A0A0A8ZAQ9_ARUDO
MIKNTEEPRRNNDYYLGGKQNSCNQTILN